MGYSNGWVRSRQFDNFLEKERTYSLSSYKLPNASREVKNEFWKTTMYFQHFTTSRKLIATLRTNIQQFRLHSSEFSNVLNFFLIVSYSKNGHHNSWPSFMIIYFKSDFLTKWSNRLTNSKWIKKYDWPFCIATRIILVNSLWIKSICLGSKRQWNREE